MTQLSSNTFIFLMTYNHNITTYFSKIKLINIHILQLLVISIQVTSLPTDFEVRAGQPTFMILLLDQPIGFFYLSSLGQPNRFIIYILVMRSSLHQSIKALCTLIDQISSSIYE